MTDLPDTFPQADDPDHVRLRKAWALARFPRDAVSGPALRLSGAEALFELGEIGQAELDRYRREARDADH